MSQKHVFLSYNQGDYAEAEALRNDLIAAGFEVWWDNMILAGQERGNEMRAAMRSSGAVLFCLSQNGVEKKKKKGKKKKKDKKHDETSLYPEALDAYRKYSPDDALLIPVRLSPCDIPPLEIDATRTLDQLQPVDLFPPERRPLGMMRLQASLQTVMQTAPADDAVEAAPTAPPNAAGDGESKPAPPLADPELDPKTKNLILFSGIVLLFVLIALIVWLLAATGGSFKGGEWPAFYVAVALVSGIAFWFFTAGSTGEYTSKQLGIRLGGGAAIGAAFMVLAHFLTPATPPSNLLVVDARNEGESADLGFALESWSEGLRNVTHLDKENNGTQFLVEFREDQGFFTVSYYMADSTHHRKIEVERGQSDSITKQEVPGQ